MPTHSGPNIVEDGLVLLLDAADNNSYPLNGLEVEYLIVAGGGGGGGGESNVNGGGGGGGGAGGVLFGKKNIDFSNFTISVGNGGSGGSTSNAGSDGTDSSAFDLTAFGGGGGGRDEGEGRSGGSGGGSGGDKEGSGGSNINSQGFPGGRDVGSSRVGGGGGGAGGPGFDGIDSSGKQDGSKGGVGIYFGDRFGNNYGENGWFAGGGGGGGNQGFVNQVPVSGLGGIGGGGNSDGIRDGSNKNSTSGQANTGGGGGAGRASKIGRSGGSGIVLVRYKGLQKAKGGIVTEKGGYTIHAFTSSGTFEVGKFIGSIVDNSIGELQNGVGSSTDNLGIFEFDGVDDYLKIDSNNKFLFNTGDSISIECWVNCSDISSNTYQAFFTIGGSVDVLRDRMIQMRISQYTQYGYVDMLHRDSNNTQWQILKTSSPIIQNNNWYHIVGTLTYGTGSTWIIYVNGVEISTTYHSGDGNTNPIQPSDVSLYIGAGEDGSGEYINGKVAMIKLYNRALTPQEVKQNYNATKSRFGL